MRSILLVEDDEDYGELMEVAIENSQIIRAFSARDVKKVLPNAVEESLSIGVVLLDLRMPDASGLEILQFIRSHEDSRIRGLPVVIMTASENPDDVLAAYSCGANSFVRKPMDFEDFKNVLRAIRNYWLDHNVLP